MDRLHAHITVALARVLLHYDHHRVFVSGRLGILITYPVMQAIIEDDLPDDALVEIEVVFHEAAIGHPPSPPQIQTMVAALTFHQ